MMKRIAGIVVLLSGSLAAVNPVSAQFVNDSTDYEIHRERCRFQIISNASDTTIAMCSGTVIFSRDKITFKPDEPIIKKIDEDRFFKMRSLGVYVGNVSDIHINEEKDLIKFDSCNKHCVIVSPDVRQAKKQLEEAVYQNLLAESNAKQEP